MDLIKLPKIPKGYILKKGYLSTFDLDENILLDLIDINDVNKYLIVKGDGEYISIDKDHPIKDRVVNIAFKSTEKKLRNEKKQPVSYYHAKVWLFIYESDSGDKVSKLVIQSRNLYRYDSIEVVLSFTGKRVSVRQEKNTPLEHYFTSLLSFMEGDKKDFISDLISEIPYYCFTLDNKEYDISDFSFITPICSEASLFTRPYDELLVISPFINVESIKNLLRIRKDNSRVVIISQASIIESLILNDVKDVSYISPLITDKFIHSKLYLVRYEDTWDIYLGSMNLSRYSISKNIEALVHLQNVKNITSVEAFVKSFIGVDISNELSQYTSNIEDKDISPIFNNAYKIDTRIRYIKKLVSNQKYDEGYMNKATSYLLSSSSVINLIEHASLKKDLIPVKHQVITGKDKVRDVYKLSFEDNTLLGLINYSLHQYDYLFSKNVYLHVLDRSIDHLFIKLHEIDDLKDYYLFRSDIHNFDPSIDKKILCSQIDRLLSFDKHISLFLKKIVNEDRYYLEGKDDIYKDDVIHQTGLPLGGVFENIYLFDFDKECESSPIYFRCGDDILIGSKDKKELEGYVSKVRELLKEKKLTISEHKTVIASPGDKVAYLGWNIVNGEIDFSDEALLGVQKTIKKKTKELLIMYGKKKLPHVLRLPSIIKYVNHYQKSEFFLNSFEKVTTTEGLKKIDKMIMDLIRTVVSGKTGNLKYKIKYKSIQAFGYKSLVNQYYEYISINKKL